MMLFMRSSPRLHAAAGLLFASLLFLQSNVTGQPPLRQTLDSERTWDLVIYGGTSAGITCATTAAGLGHSVVVLCPSGRIGGLSASGLGATDIGNKRAIGGKSREFYRRIRAHYEADDAWVHEERSKFRGWRDEDALWYFEPKVAETTFAAMITEANVPVVLGERIDLEAGCTVEDGRIKALVAESGRRWRGRVFVDATYEGDLLAKAGVSYTVGREACDTHGETLNGVQVARSVKHQFVKNVDPYVKPGDPESGLLFGIQKGGPGTDGEGDQRVQAYCFRVCMTDVPNNRVPFAKPSGYDESWYELMLRNLEAGDHRIPYSIIRMPNRKSDTNNNFAISTDFIGMSWSWPEASHAKREELFAFHKQWQQGLHWTLANHPRSPKKVRDRVAKWGLAKDEFVATGNWPHAIYVREGRRMVSSYVMTENDCKARRRCEDPVGLAAYNMDSHNVQRYVNADGFVRNEGDVQVPPTKPYPISYRAIVPKRAECKNLFVPVCLSSSHMAYGSIRMEPVFMILGQSAAIAADLAIRGQHDVQDVPYDELKSRLLAAGQILSWK